MSQHRLTVYSNESCVQCNATYRALDKKRINYATDDAQEATNNEMLKGLGLMQTPGVVVRDVQGNVVDSWGGFRPDKVEEWAPALPKHMPEPAELLAA